MGKASPLVAVVEDDLPTLTALGRLLRASGFEIASYTSAEEFLAGPVAPAPGCLLLDIQLGGMSGLELQRELKVRGCTIPVIMLTAFDDERVRQEACGIGCAAYFDKDVDVDVLIGRIQSILACS